MFICIQMTPSSYYIVSALSAVNSIQHCFTNLEVALKNNSKYVETVIISTDRGVGIETVTEFKYLER